MLRNVLLKGCEKQTVTYGHWHANGIAASVHPATVAVLKQHDNIRRERRRLECEVSSVERLRNDVFSGDTPLTENRVKRNSNAIYLARRRVYSGISFFFPRSVKCGRTDGCFVDQSGVNKLANEWMNDSMGDDTCAAESIVFPIDNAAPLQLRKARFWRSLRYWHAWLELKL